MPAALAAQQTLHVSVAGSDANSGSAELPLRTLQRAADRAGVGATILLHTGVYVGQVVITRSGSASQPITLAPAGDGPVTLNAPLVTRSCAATDPTRDRTLVILNGTDHWIIRDLTIAGGILVAGTNAADLTPHLRDRSLPGRGEYDPEAAKGTLHSLGSDPADGIQILDNTITGRGIYAVAARYGRIEGNEIADVACGTGGGIWLGRFSDGWTIRRNHIHDLQASVKHHMTEGIRHSGASDYNLIEDNLVEDAAGLGRGISTDVFSSWNVIKRNHVSRANHGFSEQSAGWGNRWIENTSEANRSAGFSIYVVGQDEEDFGTDGIPSFLEMSCNRSVDDAVALNVGGVRTSAFDDNEFSTVSLSENVKGYWKEAGNTWNGNLRPPSARPPIHPSRVWGDANRDGRVDDDDAHLVLRHVTGQLVEPEQIELGDVTADGRITSIDALSISQYANGSTSGGSRAGERVPCD